MSIEQDLMVEKVIQAMIPDLRIALGQLLSGKSVHMFNFCQGTNSQTGVKTALVCFLSQQHSAILIESVIQGAVAAEKFVMDQMEAARPKVTM